MILYTHLYKVIRFYLARLSYHRMKQMSIFNSVFPTANTAKGLIFSDFCAMILLSES